MSSPPDALTFVLDLGPVPAVEFNYADSDIAYQGRIEAVDGTPVVTELTVAAPSGLTVNLLRSVPLGKLIPWGAETVGNLARLMGEPTAAAFGVGGVSSMLERPAGRGGRPTLPDSHFEMVARKYLETQSSFGGPNGVMGELARKLAADESTVRRWVKRAEDLGFLSKARQGVGGRTAGQQLKEVPK